MSYKWYCSNCESWFDEPFEKYVCDDGSEFYSCICGSSRIKSRKMPSIKPASGRYVDIQKEVIKKYNVTVHEGCIKNSWSRMHAHIKERAVCKWVAKNSVAATFDLFHEIGHIETTTSKMRRCESEYYATVWAIEKAKEYGLEIPQKTREVYQRYIDMELARGKRRGGSGYLDGYELKWD